MECQLCKTDHSYMITPSDIDFLEDYAIKIDIEEELLEEMLDTQNKYRKLQKQLRDLYDGKQLSK